MNPARIGLVLTALVLALGCTREPPATAPEAVGPVEEPLAGPAGKPVVYQVVTRLFGNTTTTNKPWGTIEENGVGKFGDFTFEALRGIRELGVTHIWYTGVLHHAVIRDYTAFGISNDDPEVVKGRAGSPFAVKDYYNVNPDLAEDPAHRLREFRSLINRTHRQGMKVLIDIVPNHVARRYESLAKPEDVTDFGANDDTSVAYHRDNNFYYMVGEDFQVPQTGGDYQPLGGEPHPLVDGSFDESPAKWDGNGSRLARPRHDDWYETVKINHGVKPDGTYDFPGLPADFESKDVSDHHAFWVDRDVPDSWKKFRDIVLYWTEFGVDGFHYDMAEMVPVEFWSYLNSAIKAVNPDAFLMAEVNQPDRYRPYIHLGKMDYLYGKAGFYDTIGKIVQGRGSTDELRRVHSRVEDIEQHMLRFLENHDEQRIASPDFAGDAQKGRPAMVVAATISSSPAMLYFGQEVGETGTGDPGFGDPARTTIFDYWGVPAHQRWMNGGQFDGGGLDDEERDLREFYRRLMKFSATNPAMLGSYAEIHSKNRAAGNEYGDRLFSFVRWQGDNRFIVAVNFDTDRSYDIDMRLPADIVEAWRLHDGYYYLSEQLYRRKNSRLMVRDNSAIFRIYLAPLEAVIFKLSESR